MEPLRATHYLPKDLHLQFEDPVPSPKLLIAAIGIAVAITIVAEDTTAGIQDAVKEKQSFSPPQSKVFSLSSSSLQIS